MSKELEVEHGIVCRRAGERLGYFGWPTVARLDDGTLVVASSGLRSEHECPYGKTVLNFSQDDGQTWSPPRVINDSPLDDRDAGILHLGGGRLLVTWFISATRMHWTGVREWLSAEEEADWQKTISAWTDDMLSQWLGSWILLSDDRGATWSEPVRSPVSTPCGPGLLANGDLLYLGKDAREMGEGYILAARSRDGGRSWTVEGTVPLFPGTAAANYHEPHVVELADGRLLGMIRVENCEQCRLEDLGLVNFSLMQTESLDGGKTWSVPQALGFHGSPPHLLRHSSGALVCVYGYRQEGFGQRAMLSYDQGATWEHDWVLRKDGIDFDLGYPSSVELGDGSILTVYYQKVVGDRKCSLLWTRWKLPRGV